MAAGCCIVSSRTPPVQEVIRDSDNGLLVDFFDVEGLGERIATALAAKEDGAVNRLRAAARQTVIVRYDLNTICLPAYLQLLRSLLPAGRKI